MNKVVDYIASHAERTTERVAIVIGSLKVSYAELWEKIEQRAESLRDTGYIEGSPVVFRFSTDIESLATYLAAHRIGAVAVPLERDCPESTFEEILHRVTLRTVPTDTADILFTTGTTGKAKGVIISHKAIIANTENLIEAHQYTPETVFIINGPLNHIGSLSKVMATLAVGGSLILIEGMADINRFFAALDYPSERIASFLVPASIRLILQQSGDRLKDYSHKIDFIETGGASTSLHDMQQLCSILPHTRLYNTYASTETGIIATYDFQAEGTVEGCVGRKMKHAKYYISEAGTIICSGETLMSGYLDSPDIEREVFQASKFITSDIATLSPKGLLIIRGRNDDIINIGGYKVSPLDIENAAMEIEGIKECICIASHHKVLGIALKLIYVATKDSHLNARLIAQSLSSKLSRYQIPLLYEEAEEIQRTYNGKINRKYYRQI